MSYILDALRKAEAERNLGTAAVPPQAQAAATITAPAAQQSRPWPWIIAAALACALGALAWLRPLLTPPPPSPAVPASVVAAQAPSAAPRASESSGAKPVPHQEKEETHKAAPKNPPARKTEKTAVAKKAAAPVPDAVPAPVATLHDLPVELQKQIPPLKVGGYIYSTNQAERSVLINNRLLTEGDEVAPGLILERMLPDGMVMRYQGYRYRMRY